MAISTTRHLPDPIKPHPARLAILISECLDELDAKGADLGSMVAITIGRHPNYPTSTTVEAKVAAMKPEGWIPANGLRLPDGVSVSVKPAHPLDTHVIGPDCGDPRCPIDHSDIEE